jgi:hypothetical protein
MVPLYRLVQDHRRDYYTSRTAAIESCSHPTPPSYIRHHKSTPGSSPYGFRCRECMPFTNPSSASMLSSSLGTIVNKCTHKTLCNHCNYLSNLQREGGKLPSFNRSSGHVSDVIFSCSVALARLFFSSTLEV